MWRDLVALLLFFSGSSFAAPPEFFVDDFEAAYGVCAGERDYLGTGCSCNYIDNSTLYLCCSANNVCDEDDAYIIYRFEPTPVSPTQALEIGFVHLFMFLGWICGFVFILIFR